MNSILIDHNIEGQTMLLEGVLSTAGWHELIPISFVTFADVGLPYNSTDRIVWRFAQENRMFLLTANRRMIEKDSLEQTIREENTPNSLPVLTIANVNHMMEKTYREQCATRILEICLDLENYLGTGRIFIP